MPTVSEHRLELVDGRTLHYYDARAVVGYSTGGPHALACAALLPDQVVATVTLACIGPYGVEGLDYYDGMGVEREMKAAVQGPAELERQLIAGEPEPDPSVGARRGRPTGPGRAHPLDRRARAWR